jgi:hypothetical protein
MESCLLLLKQLKFWKSITATEYCYITFSMYMDKFTYLLHSCPSYFREDNSFPLKDGGMTCVWRCLATAPWQKPSWYVGRAVQYRICNIKKMRCVERERQRVDKERKQLLGGFRFVQLRQPSSQRRCIRKPQSYGEAQNKSELSINFKLCHSHTLSENTQIRFVTSISKKR